MGFFNMPQICNMRQTALLPFRRKACWGFFRPKKIRRLWPGLNPRTWVPEASMLTTRPPKPLTEIMSCVTVTFTMTELADQFQHDNAPVHSTNLMQAFFWQSLSALLQSRFGYLQLLTLPKGKISVERGEICECKHHTVHEISQWCFTADRLAPWESDCSRIRSKVSSDLLPRYTKATWIVFEIFKMEWYSLDSPRRWWMKYQQMRSIIIYYYINTLLHVSAP
jgi:hypothetical protein